MAGGPRRIAECERISDYLFLHAERHPEREFAVLGDQRLSYADAAEQVRRLSRALLASGVRPGDRVATLSTPRPECPLTLLAAADIGAIWIGLNPRYRLEEFRHVIQDSRPRVLFGLTRHGDRDYRDDLAVLAREPSVERLVAIGGDMPGADSFDDMQAEGATMEDLQRIGAREQAGGRQPALIVYTSGTTGKPKGALITHKGLSWGFLQQWRRWRIDPLRMISNLPVNHIGWAGDILCTCLVGGGTLVCMERFDADGILEVIPRERVNVLFQVPTMLQLIASRPAFETADLSSLEMVLWGGAAMPRAVVEEYGRRSPARPEVMYGLTEGTVTITYSDRSATLEQLTETIGHPDPDLEVRLARPDGTPCERGEEGEIQVRHPTVFAGYWERPEDTAEAFTADGFLRTGDLAVERPDGYYKISGRLKEMFKSGGYNVYPREVELRLESHEAVSIAAVVSTPDPVYDEVGHAFVVLRHGRGASAEELRDWCRRHLANYKVPKSVRIVETLPTLPVGKVDKAALRGQVGELLEVGPEPAPEPVRTARRTR